MDPSRRSNSDDHNNSEEKHVSLIKPDLNTTLYLEDDNNSFVNDLSLGLKDESLHSVESDVKPIWVNDQPFNLGNSDELIDVLKPEQVRWFYKSLSNKLWVEFNGYDSLRIEKKLKSLNDREWKLFNSTFSSQKNKDRTPTPSLTLECLKNGSNESTKSVPTSTNGNNSPSSETADKIVVRGGLYEVDLLKRNCSSIFWPGEETVITRGTWFYENTWQPVEIEISEDLENFHLSQFIGKKNSEFIQEAKAPKKVLHTKLIAENNIDWYGPMEVYLYSQATPSKIVRNLTSRLGGYFQKKSGYRLLRGYKDVATDKDKPKDISHLVFVIHGIGEKMEGRVFHNTTLIRQNVTSLHEKLFPSSDQRAEFFPVEWRTNLTLDEGLVEAITPLHLTQLRNILNTSAMDIMYYTSPIYCAEIQNGLITELNRLYAMFLERNPSHDVKVSILAHSLGCVIVYDIITGWLPQAPADLYDRVPEEIVPGKSRLNFHVDNLFLLGSPLAVFLALRFPRGQHGYHLFPPSLCNRLYNVFHISDAVAYRLEPLVIRDYARIAPLHIWPCNSATRIPYCDMSLELIDPQDIAWSKEATGTSTTPRDETSMSPAETPVRDRGWSIWSLVRGSSNKNQDGVVSPQQMDSPTRGNCLEHRLDYVIKVSGSLGMSARTYLNMISSHTAYWSSEDVAFFVLTRVFPELDQMVDPALPVAETPTPPSPGYEPT